MNNRRALHFAHFLCRALVCAVLKKSHVNVIKRDFYFSPLGTSRTAVDRDDITLTLCHRDHCHVVHVDGGLQEGVEPSIIDGAWRSMVQPSNYCRNMYSSLGLA